MTREFVGVSESDAVGAAVELLLDEGVDSAVVLRGQTPVGMLSARDALAAFVNGRENGALADNSEGVLARGEPNPAEMRVSHVMTAPAPEIDASDALSEAEERMVSEAVGRLLVVEDGGLVGVLTAGDLMAATRSHASEEQHTVAEVADDRSAPGASESAYDADETDYATQSICEVCGTFADGLTNANGQLVCADCLEI